MRGEYRVSLTKLSQTSARIAGFLEGVRVSMP